MNGLQGRVALVTGAAGLIGSAIARRFTEEGATVLASSRQAPETSAGTGSQHPLPIQLELSDAGSIRAAFARAEQTTGIPTILIANASLREGLDTDFAKLSHADFSRIYEVDVAGHFLCAREMVERARPGAAVAIVFIASIYGICGVDPRIYPSDETPAPPQYAAAKAGVLGLTRHLAGMWGSRNVRVNAVVAGGVRRPEEPVGTLVQNYSRKTMLGRMGTAAEIAAAAAFLASDDASYITGAVLAVDGGFSAW